MVNYFVQHSHVATGKFQSLHGKTDLRGSWEELVSHLNSMGKDGKTKDIKSWKSTWRDNKSAVSQKVAKIHANKTATGNIGGPPIKLTEREQKILGLMGFDYVDGIECPDSFPEEQAEAMNLLTEGQEEILNVIPESLTVRDSNDVNSVNNIDYEMLYNMDGERSSFDIVVVEAPSHIQNVETAEHHHEITDSSSSSQSIDKGTKIVQSYMITQDMNKKQKILRTTKRNTVKLSTQLQNAREDFVILVERQISCMEMFAKAMQKIADNDKEWNESLRAFLEVENSREKTYSKLTTIIKDCVNVLKNNDKM